MRLLAEKTGQYWLSWNLQYHIHLSKKVNVQNKTAKEHIKDDTSTFRELLKGVTYTGDSMAEKTLIGDVLIAHGTFKTENGTIPSAKRDNRIEMTKESITCLMEKAKILFIEGLAYIPLPQETLSACMDPETKGPCS